MKLAITYALAQSTKLAVVSGRSCSFSGSVRLSLGCLPFSPRHG